MKLRKLFYLPIFIIALPLVILPLLFIAWVNDSKFMTPGYLWDVFVDAFFG